MPSTLCSASSILMATPRSTSSGVPPRKGTSTVDRLRGEGGKGFLADGDRGAAPPARIVSIRMLATTGLLANQAMIGCAVAGEWARRSGQVSAE